MLLVGWLLLMTSIPETLHPPWNVHGDFALPFSEQKGANLEGTCFSPGSGGADHALTAARFAQFDENLPLYGKQQNAPEDFSLALVRVVQGTTILQDRTFHDEPIPLFLPTSKPEDEAS